MGDFLGTGATFQADLNLCLQVLGAVVLLGGMFLARSGRYTIHKYVQSAVVLGNLLLIAFIMAPAYFQQVAPNVPSGLGTSFYWVATVHGIAGLVVEVFGLYVILAAGTKILPQRLRFTNFKLWMRTLLVSWWVVVLLGVGVYYTWYLAPGPKIGAVSGSHGAHAFTILISDFKFAPKVVSIAPGTAVTWVDTQGQHGVLPLTKAFVGSKLLLPGEKYTYTFTTPGKYRYECLVHLSAMPGEIIVR